MLKHVATALDERTAAALLPALLHRINNTTQTLVAVRSLLDLGDLPPRGAEELARASTAAHEEGWLLGVIAGGLGADLLLARHESKGLVPLMRLVRDARLRAGSELDFDPASTPRLVAPRPGCPEAWRVSWGVATLLMASGTGVDSRRGLRAHFEFDGALITLAVDGGAHAEWLGAAECVVQRLGHGAAHQRDGDAWRFTLPLESAEPAR